MDENELSDIFDNPPLPPPPSHHVFIPPTANQVIKQREEKYDEYIKLLDSTVREYSRLCPNGAHLIRKINAMIHNINALDGHIKILQDGGKHCDEMRRTMRRHKRRHKVPTKSKQKTVRKKS
jgi:hypothetical protein